MMKNLKLNASPLEVVVFVIFILYLLVPMKIPLFLANMINNPIGMLVIVLVTIYLLLNVHPILGVLSIIVAYELIRRSKDKKVKHVRFEQPTQSNKDMQMKKMNPPKSQSLEENVIEKMAPVKTSTQYINSSYKPVSEDTHSALLI